MSGMRALRAGVALATVGAALLSAPGALASGPYAIDAHVDGVAGGGNYAPSSYHWNEPFEITFTHTTDASSVALMALAQGHQDVGSAVVRQTLQGTAVVTLQMSGVRIEVVREDGNVNSPSGPEETVVLRFRKVVYTYQPVTPTGQKNGPPVTFAFNR